MLYYRTFFLFSGDFLKTCESPTVSPCGVGIGLSLPLDASRGGHLADRRGFEPLSQRLGRCILLRWKSDLCVVGPY